MRGFTQVRLQESHNQGAPAPFPPFLNSKHFCQLMWEPVLWKLEVISILSHESQFLKCFYSFRGLVLRQVCAGRAPPRRSQLAGHRSRVVNVCWTNVILRSRFLVCRCRTLWNIMARLSRVYQFPMALQKAGCLLFSPVCVVSLFASVFCPNT